MLKTLFIALALLFASVGTAGADYLWKGDTVLTKYPCGDIEALVGMTKAYVVSKPDGDAVYAIVTSAATSTDRVN